MDFQGPRGCNGRGKGLRDNWRDTLEFFRYLINLSGRSSDLIPNTDDDPCVCVRPSYSYPVTARFEAQQV